MIESDMFFHLMGVEDDAVAVRTNGLGRRKEDGNYGGGGYASSSSSSSSRAGHRHPPSMEGQQEHSTSGTSNSSSTATAHEATTEEEVVIRKGTIASARFNILSTMVGGGALSLPLAFDKCGNTAVGPVMLLTVAAITEYSLRVLVACSRVRNPPDFASRGSDSYDLVAHAAFGRAGKACSSLLVVFMCFFGSVGYAVLLRDMLEPVNEAVFHQQHGSSSSSSSSSSVVAPEEENVVPFTRDDWWTHNVIMLLVVVLMTPLCTLKTITSLQRVGAASLLCSFLTGALVVYRSVQCNLGLLNDDVATGTMNDEYQQQQQQHDDDGTAVGIVLPFQWFPDSWQDVLDAFPLYVFCYVCHFNLLPAHNDLRAPTPPRVSWWLRSSIWSSTAFYMILGVAGSAYRPCTAAGQVQGNILLDLDPRRGDSDSDSDDDPLLFAGRICLAITTATAFPMMIIPARDIILRFILTTKTAAAAAAAGGNDNRSNDDGTDEDSEIIEFLREPLLSPPPSPSSSSSSSDGDIFRQRREYYTNDVPPWFGTIGTAPDTIAAAVTTTASNNDKDDVTHECGSSTDAPSSSSSSSASANTPPESSSPSSTTTETDSEDLSSPSSSSSLGMRWLVVVMLFWSSAAVASCVTTIDVVWDLVGSSVSMLVAYLIPTGCYLILTSQTRLQSTTTTEDEDDDNDDDARRKRRRCRSLIGAALVLAVTAPLMVLSTANAVRNVFFLHPK